jgi:tetratricopeptide (TPR) repeat protein
VVLVATAEQLGAITDAIIYVSRADLRPIFRKVLKDLGIGTVVTPDTVDDCIIELVKSDHGLLILDWTDDTAELVKILGAAQGSYSADTRPIFLLSSEINSDVLAIGAEYNVSRVHSGPVSVQTINGHLSTIVIGGDNVSSLRSQLAKIAAIQSTHDWDNAGDQLNDLRDDFGDDPRVLAELINNLINQEKWDTALEVATELMKLHPNDLRGMHLYGRCMLKFSRYKDACTVLKAANFLNPYNSDRLIDLGNALLNMDAISEAEANFTAAMDLQTGSVEAIKGKSRCRLLEGDVNEALSLLRQLSSTRELASVFNDSAIISIRMGRFQAGIQLYRAAIKAVGPKPMVAAKLYFNLGLAFHKAGEIESAYEAFKAGAQSDRQFAPGVFNFRVYAQRLGKTDELQKIIGLGKSPKRPDVPDQSGKDLIDDFEDSFDDEKFS